MRAHVIEGGRVVNTIEVASLGLLPNLIAADNGGQVGDLWNGETFSTPPPIIPVPAAVSMRQARLALLAGGMLADVDAAIAALPEPQKSQAAIAWEYSQEVRRNDGFVSMLGAALGLTEDQIDQLFVEAVNL